MVYALHKGLQPKGCDVRQAVACAAVHWALHHDDIQVVVPGCAVHIPLHCIQHAQGVLASDKFKEEWECVSKIVVRRDCALGLKLGLCTNCAPHYITLSLGPNPLLLV